MGLTLSSTTITEAEMEDYLDLTYLTRNEIIQVYQRFISYLPAGAEPREASLQMADSARIPELKVNPFRERIWTVFSSKGDGSLTFEDYLDLMSVFSESAPTQIKIEYAFRIYDFDNDEMLGDEDIKCAIRLLTGAKEQLDEAGVNLIVDKIFAEADLDGDRKLCYAEFEHAMTKSMDFATTYCIRL